MSIDDIVGVVGVPFGCVSNPSQVTPRHSYSYNGTSYCFDGRECKYMTIQHELGNNGPSLVRICHYKCITTFI